MFMTVVFLLLILGISYSIYTFTEAYKKYKRKELNNQNTQANLTSYLEKAVKGNTRALKDLKIDKVFDDLMGVMIPPDLLSDRGMSQHIFMSPKEHLQYIDVEKFIDLLSIDPNVDELTIYDTKKTIETGKSTLYAEDLVQSGSTNFALLKLTVNNEHVYIYIPALKKRIVNQEEFDVYAEGVLKSIEEQTDGFYSTGVCNRVVVLGGIPDNISLKLKMIEYYVEESIVYAVPGNKSKLLFGEFTAFGGINIINSSIPHIENLLPFDNYPVKKIKVQSELIEVNKEKRSEFVNTLAELIVNPEDTSHILIQGKSGSGKSTLIKRVLNTIYNKTEELRPNITIYMEEDGKNFMSAIQNDPATLRNYTKKYGKKSVVIIDNANEIVTNKRYVDVLASIMDGVNAIDNLQIIFLVNENSMDNIAKDFKRTGRIDLNIMLEDLTVEEFIENLQILQELIPEESNKYVDINKAQSKEPPYTIADCFGYIKSKNSNDQLKRILEEYKK